MIDGSSSREEGMKLYWEQAEQSIREINKEMELQRKPMQNGQN